MTTSAEFRALMKKPEGTRVEFKSASGGFHFDELVKYCVALANEGGGKIILGVTDGRPRRVSGTRAFSEPGRTEAGLFERLGRGLGTRMLLSQRFYRHLGRPGVYTRKRGLDQETNKALLLKHVTDRGAEGAPFSELVQVLPNLTRRQIQYLVERLKREGLIMLKGTKKGSKWYRVA